MLALALTAALALSTPGTLDRGFGHDGRVVTPAGGIGVVGGVEALPHGQTALVVTVDYRKIIVIRYRRDGSIAKRTPIAFDRDVIARDTLLDARGRLLVAGGLGTFGKRGSDALLLRFDRAGHLDPSLDGDGISLTSFDPNAAAVASAIALAADGSILMAADLDTNPGGDLGLTRLHPDGSVDTSFGQQGFVRRGPAPNFDRVSARAVAVLGDGRLAVLVDHSSGKGDWSPLLRLLADGSPDPAFDPLGQGVPGPSFIADLAVAPPAGRLVVGGVRELPAASDQLEPVVSKIDSSSTQPAWQSSFRISRPGGWTYMERVAVDRRGRALAFGTSQRPGKGNGLRSEMFVARIRAHGGLDRCFGKKGIARIRFPGALSVASAIATGRDGSTVIAGTHGYPDQKVAHRFELARLRGGNCPR